MGKTMDYYQEEYIPLIEEFVTQVEQSGVQTDGIPEPCLPVIGKNYEQCKYKIAFFGIDTKGWNELSDFIIDWHSDPQQALYGWKKPLDEMEYIKWCNNSHTSFWNFVIQFLCEFYHISISRPEEFKNYTDIGTSFVWGNTNAIERYDNVKDSGVKDEDYDIVKKCSRIFDSADHVLKTIRPNVLIVLNWSEAEEWLTKFEDKSDVLRIELDTHLLYYYIRSSNTHVFWTAHPRWLSLNIPFDTIIPKIIKIIRDYNVWNTLPEKPADWCLPVSQEVDKSSIEHKRIVIKGIADCYFNMDMTMSGQELAATLRRNDIRTQYDCEYAENGRGIYTLIRDVWEFYYDKGDYLSAYHIARTFVKQNGDYAWA